VIIIPISTFCCVERVSIELFHETIVERLALPQRANLKEFSVVSVIKLEYYSILTLSEKVAGNHSDVLKIYASSPPNIVNSAG